MNFERDILNRSISPKLNYQLSRCGQSLRILDLRWGVDTSELSEQEASDRVLRVCFDAIDNCKPCILILLGDRYGFVPADSNISVTHMEIIRGAIESTSQDHIYIYFREADDTGIPESQRKVYIEQDPASAQKLAALKAQLLQLLPDRCRTYHAHWSDTEQQLISDDFEAIVSADLQAGFVDSLSSVRYRSELHRQLHENHQILRDNLRYAYRDETMIQSQVKSILDSNTPWGIIGQAGAGKSVYLSLLCSALQERSKQAQILFCGDNAFSASVRNAAETVFYLLTHAAGQEYAFESGSLLSYEELLEKIIALREHVAEKSYLLLDAVDKCDDGIINFILWCHRYLAPQIGIVFSSRMLAEITQSEKSFSLTQMQYDHAALQAMAQRILQKNGKSLNVALLEQISQKVSTPLHLQLLLLRLMNLGTSDFDAIQRSGGGMDAINAYLGSLIRNCPEDMASMIALQLQTLLDQSASRNLSALLLALLGFSEYGLQEIDLQKLCFMMDQPWVELDYLDFLSQLAFFVRTRDNGRLDISHDIIRQTIRRLLQQNKKRICAMLSRYFLHQDQPDAFCVRSFFHAAWLGEQKRCVVDFFLKYHHVFTSSNPEEYLLGQEIRKSILHTFLLDHGRFIFSSYQSCKSVNELLQFQSVLSTSLLHSNDYQSDDVIHLLVAAVMAIPTGMKEFPAALAEMELAYCENYVHRRHQVKNARIDAFLEECRQTIAQRKAKARPASAPTEDPMEQLLKQILDPAGDRTEQVLALTQLCDQSRRMAEDKKTAARAEKLLLQILQFLEEDSMDLDADIRPLLLADVYTSLGVACKTQKRWSDAIGYDQQSLDIYLARYEQNPAPDIFRKYRERVYNLANVVEAWAMEERNNTSLWQQTRDRYAHVYQLDMTAIAQGVPERELLQCASSILSYGTALLNAGDSAEAIAKYREGIQLLSELTENNPRTELYLECCIHLSECIFQLSVCKHYDAAADLCDALCDHLASAIACGESHRDTLQKYIASLSNQINDQLASMFQTGDLDGSITLSRLLSRIYITFLPIANLTVRANIILTQRNIGDILFLRKQDHAQALAEYRLLLDWVEQYDLMAPDETGAFAEEANMRLVDVYLRAMICLEKLGQKNEVGQMVEGAADWAKKLVQSIPSLQSDPAWVLYVMGCELEKRESHLCLLIWMLAFHITQEEDYDQQTHKKTVLHIMHKLSGLMGSGGTE